MSDSKVIDIVAQRKARLADEAKKQEHIRALNALGAATARRPPPIIPDSRRAQFMTPDAPDSLLIAITMYADKSMSLVSAGMNRSYTAAQIAAAAAKLPDDPIAQKLADPGRVNLVVRSLLQRGLAATSGDTFKLTTMGVFIGKSFKMPAQALLDALG